MSIEGDIMKYIFTSIQNLVKKETFIFFIMVLCIFFSSLVLNFSYGLYYNFEIEKRQNDESLKEIVLEANKEYAPTHKQVREFVEALSEDINNSVFFFVSGKLDVYPEDTYNTLDSRFTYRDGKFGIPDIYIESLEKYWYSGRPISNEEEAAGTLVAMVLNDDKTGMDEITKSLGDGETYIELWGKKFNIVGESATHSNTPTVPFLSIPDDFVYDDLMWIVCDNYITRGMYEELRDKAQIYMPNAFAFPELQLPDDDSVKLYNNMIAIAVLISVLSALNLAVLFQYVLIKRNRTLSIFRLCGITRIKSALYYLAECYIISVPIYIIATLIFTVLLKSTLSSLFTYIAQGYSAKIYIEIFLLYIIVLTAAMSVMLGFRIKKSIVSQWKGETV